MRSYIAVIATLLWVDFWTLFALNLSHTWGELGINEVGDFLAGVFAPVAFFWLVLGHFQTQRELTLTRQTLTLQQRELRSSALQQKKLAELSADELKFLLQEAEDRRRRDVLEAEPYFTAIDYQTDNDPDVPYKFGIKFSNSGSRIRNVRAHLVRVEGIDNIYLEYFFKEVWEGDSQWVLWFVREDEIPLTDRELIEIRFKYVDLLGGKREKNIVVSRTRDGGVGSLDQSPIATA